MNGYGVCLWGIVLIDVLGMKFDGVGMIGYEVE